MEENKNYFQASLSYISDKTLKHSAFVDNIRKQTETNLPSLIEQWNLLHDDQRGKIFQFLLLLGDNNSTRTVVRNIFHVLLENTQAVVSGINDTSFLQRLELGDQYFHPWKSDKKAIELEQQAVINFCQVLSMRGLSDYLSKKDPDDIKFAKILNPLLSYPLQSSNNNTSTIFGIDSTGDLPKQIIATAWACCLAAHLEEPHKFLSTVAHQHSINRLQRTKNNDMSPHLFAECLHQLSEEKKDFLYICPGSPTFSVSNVKVDKQFNIDVHLSEEGVVNTAYTLLTRNIPIISLIQKLSEGWYLVITGYAEFSGVAELLLIRLLSHQTFKINQSVWKERVLFVGFGSPGVGCDVFHKVMMERRIEDKRWTDLFYHVVLSHNNWVPSFGHYWILDESTDEKLKKTCIDVPSIVPDIKELIANATKDTDTHITRKQYTQQLLDANLIKFSEQPPNKGTWSDLFPVYDVIDALHHVNHDILDITVQGQNLQTISLDNICVEEVNIREIKDTIHSTDVDTSGKLLRLTVSWQVQSDFITLVLPSRYEGISDIKETVELKRMRDTEYLDNLPLWGLLDYSFFHSLLMSPYDNSDHSTFKEATQRYLIIENILMSSWDTNLAVVARCLAWITTNTNSHQNFKKKILKRILQDPTEAEEFVTGLKSGSWGGKLWAWLGHEESKVREHLKEAYIKSQEGFIDLFDDSPLQENDDTILPPMIKITRLIEHWQQAIAKSRGNSPKSEYGSKYPSISRYFSAALSAHYYMSMTLQLSRFPSLVLQKYNTFWNKFGRAVTAPLRVVGIQVLPDRILKVVEGTYIDRLQQSYCMLKFQADPDLLITDKPINDMESEVLSIHNPLNKPYEFTKQDWAQFNQFIELVGAFHFLRNKVKKTTFLVVRGPKNSGKTTLFREVFNIQNVNPSDNEGTMEPTAYSVKDIVHKQFKEDERLQEFYIVDYPGSNEPSTLKRTMQDFVTPCALGVIIMLEAKNACTSEAYSVIMDTIENANHCPLLVLMNRSDQLLENTYQNLLDAHTNTESSKKKKKVTGLIKRQRTNTQPVINPTLKIQALQEFWTAINKNQQHILEACAGLTQNQIYTTAANWSRIQRDAENTGTIIGNCLKQVMSIPDLEYSEKLFDLDRMDELGKSEDQRIFSRLGILWLLRYNFCKLRPQTPLRRPLEIITYPKYLEESDEEEEDE